MLFPSFTFSSNVRGGKKHDSDSNEETENHDSSDNSSISATAITNHNNEIDIKREQKIEREPNYREMKIIENLQKLINDINERRQEEESDDEDEDCCIIL